MQLRKDIAQIAVQPAVAVCPRQPERKPFTPLPDADLCALFTAPAERRPHVPLFAFYIVPVQKPAPKTLFGIFLHCTVLLCFFVQYTFFLSVPLALHENPCGRTIRWRILLSVDIRGKARYNRAAR